MWGMAWPRRGLRPCAGARGAVRGAGPVAGLGGGGWGGGDVGTVSRVCLGGRRRGPEVRGGAIRRPTGATGREGPASQGERDGARGHECANGPPPAETS